MKTVFLRVLEAKDKAAALLDAVREPERARGRQRFEVDPTSFASVPRSPFAYWVSEKLLRHFASADPLHHQARLVVSTNPLNDDFRYVRSWWEAAPNGLRRIWMPWAKGGSYSPIYYDIDTMIRWDGARLTYAGFLGTENRPLERPASVQHFFRPGLTWPRRTNGLSLRAMPAGCIFADKGPAAFVENDDIRDLLALACITNSRAFGLLVSLQLARTELAQSYEVGLIQTTPVPNLADSDREALARLARRTWSLKRSLDARTETSHAFTIPALLQVAGADIAARAAAWSEHVRTVEADLADIQAEIDDRCFALYGIDEADRRAMTEGFGTQNSEEASSDGANDAEDDAGEDTDENESTADATGLAAELVSWAIGVAFGRFDVRLATGARPMPTEPEPFDPLPACSHGMLTGGDGLPLARPPAGYPLAFPEAGVLVDDPGHARDLTAAVRTVFGARGGATPPGCVRVPASSLGYVSDLEFVFPTGSGVFKAGGDLAFHHGGPSLQELVIPVITVRLRVRDSARPTADPVTASGLPEAVTNRIFSVTLQLGGRNLSLFSSAMLVRPLLMSSGKQVGAAGMAIDAELDRSTGCVKLQPGKPVTVAFLLSDDSVPSLRVVVQDPATDAELFRSPTDIPVRLGV